MLQRFEEKELLQLQQQGQVYISWTNVAYTIVYSASLLKQVSYEEEEAKSEGKTGHEGKQNDHNVNLLNNFFFASVYYLGKGKLYLFSNQQARLNSELKTWFISTYIQMINTRLYLGTVLVMV